MFSVLLFMVCIKVSFDFCFMIWSPSFLKHVHTPSPLTKNISFVTSPLYVQDKPIESWGNITDWMLNSTRILNSCYTMWRFAWVNIIPPPCILESLEYWNISEHVCPAWCSLIYYQRFESHLTFTGIFYTFMKFGVFLLDCLISNHHFCEVWYIFTGPTYF